MYNSVAFPFVDAMLWAIALGCLSLVLLPFVPRGPGTWCLRKLTRPPTWLFLGVLAMWILAATSAVSWRVLGHFPHDVDNVARVYQAKMLANGRLSVETPPVVGVFHAYAMIHLEDGRSFAKYEPGAALVLAAGRRLTGVAWGVGPLLSTLTVILLYGALRCWYSRRTARLAVLLLALSPFFLTMGASFHSHVPGLSFTCAFLLLFGLGQRDSGRAWQLALAGVALGAALSTRVWTSVCLSAPFGIWLLTQGPPSKRARRIMACGAGLAVPIGLLLVYNAALTGDPLRFPFQVSGPEQKPWFGYKGHTPWLGLTQTAGMLGVLNQNLFGWPLGLVPAAAYLAFGRRRKADLLFFGSASCLVLGYFVYYWADYSFGARYYYEMLPAIVLFTARGIEDAPGIARRLGMRGLRAPTVRDALLLLLSLNVVFAAAFYLPPLLSLYGRNYNFVYDTRVEENAQSHELTRALVLMGRLRGENAGWSSGFLANTLDLRAVSHLDRSRALLSSKLSREPTISELAEEIDVSESEVTRLLSEGDVIYSRDPAGDERQRSRLYAAFPGRAVWRFRFDAESGAATLRPVGRTDQPAGAAVEDHGSLASDALLGNLISR
jgi:4-amino-4-deoxy-L-arabinose transferase-like glycosyltransferase